MKEEMKALEKNSTWEIVYRPKDKRDVVYMEILLGFYSHNEKNKYANSKRHCIDLNNLPENVYVDDRIIICDDEIKKLTLKEKLTA
ncbi:hypothetical protein CR513_18577, partial [Mucuna pruriens]